MIIKVLGTGCANCKNLEKAVRTAVEELSANAIVEKVVLSGRIPSMGELKEIIQNHMNQ
jgi:hypothetical protein